MSLRGLGELGLLELIRGYLGAGAGGDDAAVIHDGHRYLVASVDMYVEGVHFDFAWMSPEDAGWRSLALALGDLAAKGARPEWALAALAIPGGWNVDQVTGLYSGMHWLAARWHMPIAGGDMSSTSGPAVLSLTVAGRTETRPLARADAKPGWAVGVTGPLGAAAVALREQKPFRLVPLVEEGMRLNSLGLACGDISDGLVREMEKFAAMSEVGSIIEAADVPRAEGASLEEALTSGEEAELVCVGPEEVVRRAGLTVVGRTTEEPEVIVVGSELETTGYDHFA
ncbi:MAG TPA: AIR synthase related protein [Candidatus Dormibacteraeota bacterium]|nr:AIR synthase related protein [Candidatus Dormibacteraeota bacterium]